MREYDKNKEYDEWMGYVPCHHKPDPVEPDDADGEGRYNIFTGRNEMYLPNNFASTMQKLILSFTHNTLGSGEYYNMYFDRFQQKPLTPMYHARVHKTCREAID